MVNRTMCDMLEEVRQCCKTGNYSYLPGLIEEIQSAGNRMEAALWDQKKFKRAEARFKKLRDKVRAMEEKVDEEDT